MLHDVQMGGEIHMYDTSEDNRPLQSVLIDAVIKSCT